MDIILFYHVYFIPLIFYIMYNKKIQYKFKRSEKLMFSKTIGIIVAMSEEYRHYEEILTEHKYNKQDILHKGSFEFHIYESAQEISNPLRTYSSKIVIVKSQIGKANAAIATTLLIHLFNPNVVLNTGAVGGIKKYLSIGDLLVGKSYKYCDVDVTALGYKKGQMPEMPVEYQGDARLLQYCKEIDPSIYYGMVGTTDSFISDKTQVEEHGVSCVDMESTSIAQTCYHFDIPFLSIKAISDQADGKAPENFTEFVEEAGKRTAQFVIKLIQKINQENH